jgi:hypothetical protein
MLYFRLSYLNFVARSELYNSVRVNGWKQVKLTNVTRRIKIKE